MLFAVMEFQILKFHVSTGRIFRENQSLELGESLQFKSYMSALEQDPQAGKNI